MLIISRDLHLTPSGDFPPFAPLVGWHTLVTKQNVAATSAAGAFPSSNLATVNTSERWQATSDADQDITVTFDASQQVDYVGIARHNLGTVAAEITVAVLEGLDWVDVIDPQVIATGDALLTRFVPTYTTSVRVSIKNATASVWASILFVGKLLQLPPHIQVGFTPLRYGRVIDMSSDESESGHFLGRTVFSEFRESTASLIYLDGDWYRQHCDAWIASTADRPFFFAWDPLHYPDETGFAYIKANSNPQPQIQDGLGRMRIDLQMRGIA